MNPYKENKIIKDPSREVGGRRASNDPKNPKKNNLEMYFNNIDPTNQFLLVQQSQHVYFWFLIKDLK